MDATILHADLDAFYASVEQVLDPRLAGRAIAVGGGVVLAASYEAKAYGVRGGMPAGEARSRCPGLTFVPGHFREYQRLSDAVMGILGDFTPLVERISIDEAFLDVRGSIHLLGSPTAMGTEIRRRVRSETGLPISVGIARTKHLAKVASQVAKPDGLVLVDPAREAEFLHPLPVDLVWGVGPVTRRRLSDLGITTIGELAAVPGGSLDHALGRSAGARLAALAHNVDPRAVVGGRRATSVGAQSAFPRRRPDPEAWVPTVRVLADRVARRLRESGRAGRTVTVRVRFADMTAVTRSATLPASIAATGILAGVAAELVSSALVDRREDLTLVAVSVSGLVTDGALQLELPLDLGGEETRPGTADAAARRALDEAVDAVRRRFGSSSVRFASASLAGDGVPEEMRELVERPARGPDDGGPTRRPEPPLHTPAPPEAEHRDPRP